MTTGPVVPAPLTFEECAAAHRQVLEWFGPQATSHPEQVQFLGWDLEYANGPALASFIDQILVRRLNDFIPDNDRPLILDCGANIGLSVLNYKRQFPRSRIVAFEPDPQFAPILRRNLERNRATDVKIVEAAVSSQNGSTPWLCEGIDGSKMVKDQRAGATVVVPTVDLADYLQDDVDLLKMDIEGAECEVIGHVGDRLQRVKAMSIECHLDQERLGPFSEMLGTLAKGGFKLGINSFGAWRDLIRQPDRLSPLHWSQYLVVSAWRNLVVAASSEDVMTAPYLSVQLRERLSQCEAAHAELQVARAKLHRYESSRLIQLAMRLKAIGRGALAPRAGSKDAR